jgi:hypothetical protein
MRSSSDSIGMRTSAKFSKEAIRYLDDFFPFGFQDLTKFRKVEHVTAAVGRHAMAYRDFGCKMKKLRDRGLGGTRFPVTERTPAFEVPDLLPTLRDLVALGNRPEIVIS